MNAPWYRIKFQSFSAPWPEPSGSPYSAGIAVVCTDESGGHRVIGRIGRTRSAGKHVLLPQKRNRPVDPLDVRQPAAEDNHIRIEQVDHRCKRTREAFFIASKCGFGILIACRRPCDNRLGLLVSSSVPVMIGSKARA